MTQEAKPNLLYVSPVIPSLTGNGLAMRSGMVIEALADAFSISLLIINLYAGIEKDVPAELGRFCRRTTIIQPPDPRKPVAAFLSRLSSRWFGPLARYHRTPLDVVHVFRLTTLSLVRTMLRNRMPETQVHLDLDDVESATHMRLAALCRSNQDMPRALFEEAEARRCLAAEEVAFREVDRIYVCSGQDKTRIERRCRTPVRVLPNAVRSPGSWPLRTVGKGFRFLFIGTLGYYPNEDAALYLCREIVPRIRRLSPCAVSFDIVGDGASERLRKVARDVDVEMVGLVPVVGTYYESAAVVAVPLRAGGGTRIKILEAFSYRRPVVSTSIGAEGLNVRHEQEILIADTPESFAHACIRLMANRPLRDLLIKNAFDLALRSYSLEAIRRIVTTP